MNTKLLAALILALAASAAQAHEGSSNSITGTSTPPGCRTVEKYRFVEKPRHNVIKEKTVVKTCCHVDKYLRKMRNGVLVKDHPVSKSRHCWKHVCH
jgi:hypothetical protein